MCFVATCDKWSTLHSWHFDGLKRYNGDFIFFPYSDESFSLRWKGVLTRHKVIVSIHVVNSLMPCFIIITKIFHFHFWSFYSFEISIAEQMIYGRSNQSRPFKWLHCDLLFDDDDQHFIPRQTQHHPTQPMACPISIKFHSLIKSTCLSIEYVRLKGIKMMNSAHLTIFKCASLETHWLRGRRVKANLKSVNFI